MVWSTLGGRPALHAAVRFDTEQIVNIDDGLSSHNSYYPASDRWLGVWHALRWMVQSTNLVAKILSSSKKVELSCVSGSIDVDFTAGAALQSLLGITSSTFTVTPGSPHVAANVHGAAFYSSTPPARFSPTFGGGHHTQGRSASGRLYQRSLVATHRDVYALAFAPKIAGSWTEVDAWDAFLSDYLVRGTTFGLWEDWSSVCDVSIVSAAAPDYVLAVESDKGARRASRGGRKDIYHEISIDCQTIDFVEGEV